MDTAKWVTRPRASRPANFCAIRYQGMAVSSTVWMQKMYSDRWPMACTPWVMKLSTWRWKKSSSDSIPRPVIASSRMLTGPKVHSAIETQSVLWVASTRPATASAEAIMPSLSFQDRGLSKNLCCLARYPT